MYIYVYIYLIRVFPVRTLGNQKVIVVVENVELQILQGNLLNLINDDCLNQQRYFWQLCQCPITVTFFLLIM